MDAENELSHKAELDGVAIALLSFFISISS